MELFTTIIAHIIGILFLIACLMIFLFVVSLGNHAFRSWNQNPKENPVFSDFNKSLEKKIERIQEETEYYKRIRSYYEYKNRQIKFRKNSNKKPKV